MTDADMNATHTIAVDLDGTLATYSGNWQSPEIGDPLPGSREFLSTLKRMGFRVLIFTSRRGDVAGWLDRWGLTQYVDEVRQDKPLYLAFLDDKNVRYEGPEDLQNLLLRLLSPPWWEEKEKADDCPA